MAYLDNKTVLFIVLVVLNIVQFGQNIILQIQNVDKRPEPENTTSQFSSNRNLLEKFSDSKKLNDTIKKINYLEINYLALKNSISNTIYQQNIKIKELQLNLTSYIKKQDLKNKMMNQTIDLINSENNNIKNQTQEYIKNSPKTILYGPYDSKKWEWQTVPLNQQLLTHPTTAKLTIQKKSLVTFTLNGHITTNGQHMQVFFVKDKEPIVNTLGDWFYYSYFSNQPFWAPLSLVQETIIELGTFLFEVGMNCLYNQQTSGVQLNGVSFTIKVQELPDTITTEN